MNEKFVPTIRFKSDQSWNKTKLSKVVKQVNRKNTNLESKLPLTISADYGLVDQTTYFNKVVASNNLSNYTIIYNGEFAYNKSHSKGYPYGAVKILKDHKKGLLSSIYIVFRASQVDDLFLKSYFDSSKWHKEIYKSSTEGARNHGLLNISKNDFYKSEIYLPICKTEQSLVGRFFKQLDELIELQQVSIFNLEKMKKAFLKKLFPHKNLLYPTVRFRNFTRNWKHVKLKKIGEIHSAGVDKKINEFDNPVTLLNYIDIYNKKPIDEKKFKKMMKVTATKQQLIEKNVMIGDIFFTPSSETREDIGHSLTITNEYSNFVYSYHIIRFRPRKNTLDINFSNYFANVEDVRKEMIKNCQGSQRFTLSLGDFRNLNVSLPHIKEQEKIGTVLKDLDDLIELENKELKLLQELKKGFLQKMFV